jgi:hypothetical protein
MDMVIDEPEQGAAVAADLLQQDSHGEAVGSKPSIVSPDEERLAAGVSMIRLQTKRLSGAQWKKLIKERKMKEGTWTVEKPPRKTPSSQKKGATGSSGGVKRPHSDSNIPPSTKQQPKIPRSMQEHTGSYKEAVVGIKMAVIHKCHPQVKLDQAQVDLIQTKLLAAVDANPSGETPLQFLHSKSVKGIFWINRANESSIIWLMRTINGLGELWEGVELAIVNSKDPPMRPRVLFTSQILQRLQLSQLISEFKILSSIQQTGYS